MLTKKIIIGRINKQKNQAAIIDLFHESDLKEKILYVIGGDLNQVEKYGTVGEHSIIFETFQSNFEFYKKFDILIVNAINEAFGRTVIEANYCGIPVLARKSGAFPEIVDEGINGWIYVNESDLKVKITEISTSAQNSIEQLKKSSVIHAKKF